MLRLPVPGADSGATFNAAVATIRDKARRKLFVSASATVQARCRDFDLLAGTMSFGDASGTAFRIPELDDGEMAALYDAQFVQGSRTRPIRESIQNAAPNGLCPYCGQGSVFELDHYLPKSVFAGTTVHPANLVPVCRDCNREKSSYAPGANQAAVLHPYFDEAIEARWLHASVAPVGGGAVVTFSVYLSSPDTDLEARLNAHIDVFKLRRRFGEWASQALDNFELLLRSPFGDSLTLAQVRRHLDLTAVQQSGGRTNSWERATFEAMSASDWYLKTYLGLR